MDLRLSLRHAGLTTSVACEGEVDESNAAAFVRLAEICLGTGPERFVVDLSRAPASPAAIQAVVSIMGMCHMAETECRVELSTELRSRLDEVGLWWIGRLDDGYGAALAMYAVAGEELND